MAFILGLISGIGIALAMRGVLLTVRTRVGVEKPRRHSRSTPHGWEHTRNFLYYDGTVMPTSEEEHYE